MRRNFLFLFTIFELSRGEDRCRQLNDLPTSGLLLDSTLFINISISIDFRLVIPDHMNKLNVVLIGDLEAQSEINFIFELNSTGYFEVVVENCNARKIVGVQLGTKIRARLVNLLLEEYVDTIRQSNQDDICIQKCSLKDDVVSFHQCSIFEASYNSQCMNETDIHVNETSLSLTFNTLTQPTTESTTSTTTTTATTTFTTTTISQTSLNIIAIFIPMLIILAILPLIPACVTTTPATTAAVALKPRNSLSITITPSLSSQPRSIQWENNLII